MLPAPRADARCITLLPFSSVASLCSLGPKVDGSAIRKGIPACPCVTSPWTIPLLLAFAHYKAQILGKGGSGYAAMLQFLVRERRQSGAERMASGPPGSGGADRLH